jgi:hypothetical protein
MAFHVYPDPQTSPLTVLANSEFPIAMNPPMPIDLSVGSGSTKTMRLVILPGGTHQVSVCSEMQR